MVGFILHIYDSHKDIKIYQIYIPYMFIGISHINLNTILSLYMYTHLYIHFAAYSGPSTMVMGYHTHIWSCGCIFNQQVLTAQHYKGKVILLHLLAPSCSTSSQWFPSSWRGNCPPCVTPIWASEKRKPHNTGMTRSLSEQLSPVAAPQLPSSYMPCSCVGSIIHLMSWPLVVLQCGAPFPSQQVVSLSHRDKATLERTQTDGSLPENTCREKCPWKGHKNTAGKWASFCC